MKYTFFLALSVLLIFSSCELEPCKDFRCINGEAQEDFNECVCLCSKGWFGEDCTMEDKCVTRQVRCVGGQGTCDPAVGICECLNGYEGDSCHIFSRDKFLENGDSSTWSARDTCGLLSPITYIVKIARPASRVELEVFNLHDIDHTRFVQVTVKRDELFQKRPIETFNGGQVEIRNFYAKISPDQNHLSVSYSFSEGLPMNCFGLWERE